MPDDQYYQFLYPEDVNKAFHTFSKLLSSQKAREALQNAESSFAFNVEIFLQPLRRDLAECFDLIADMIRERGTDGSALQRMIPVVSDWLDPGKKFALDISRLEKTIADKKRQHPDFVLAFKMQVLINRYQEQLEHDSIPPNERDDISQKLEQMKRTLADHTQKKIRIAQRAFAPDLLEMAQAQLELARKREKVLLIKQELLTAAQEHTQHTFENLAK
ncbi:MAG: hypothetical protein ACP5I1_17495, partial [Candidatus Hinthialibacter sp.]